MAKKISEMSEKELLELYEEHERQQLELDVQRAEAQYIADQEEQEARAVARLDDVLKELKEIREQTLQNNKQQIVQINYSLESFLEVFYNYLSPATKENIALVSKSTEIENCAIDSYYLSVSGRYKTAYMLMRKMLELFAIAEFIGSDGRYPSKKPEDAKFQMEVEDWLFKGNNPPEKYGPAIEEIDQTGCTHDENDLKCLQNLYHFLSSFTHNEGTPDYHFLFPKYDKDGFELYSRKMIFLLETLTEILERKSKAKSQ